MGSKHSLGNSHEVRHGVRHIGDSHEVRVLSASGEH
jgi:hypothetical protein